MGRRSGQSRQAPRRRAIQGREPVSGAVTSGQAGSSGPAPTADELWLSLRQGARNVAGVRWQIAVSVHLLVAARAGELPFAMLVPEGFEDLDCRHADGRATFVQMKDVGGGVGRLTAADVADALAHAYKAAGDSPIALVTDGDLGSGLLFTGWEGVMAEQGGRPAKDVVDHLVSRGLTHAQATEVAGRTRLVSLPWNVREVTERLLADVMGIHPLVASFTVGYLYERIGHTAADQRSTTLITAGAHLPADVDAAVGCVQSAVDVSGLDAAIAAGVCEPADYLHPSGLSAQQFYLGVDGAPAHVAADLDVLRAREMLQVIEAASGERYALILGPSGSGKSVLLWRAARDAVLGARIVRVRHAETREDVALLTRHVRLLQPTAGSPVIVAADDLGRPGMAAWPTAVDALRELPAVVLIAACRAEDFHPELARGGARIIEPRLDDQTAQLIADSIEAARLPLRVAMAEAYARCDGLLMEFIALLTSGKRLEQVLAEQAAALRRPDRRLQRAAARLVTAAHSVGLSLPADQIGAKLAVGGAVDDVGDALEVLSGEHIVTRDGTSWRGLHELRSQTLTTLLHDSPPPTLSATYTAIARILPAAEAGWLMRRVAECDPDRVLAVATAVGDHVTAAEEAADVAQLLEGAERADNALYARACLPLLQANLRPSVTVHWLAMFVYGIRYQGLWPRPTGIPEFDAMLRDLRRIARGLPERKASALSAAASGLTVGRILTLTESASLEDVTRLLEATSGIVALSADAAAELYGRFAPPEDAATADLHARLIEVLAERLDAASRGQVLGSFRDRAVAVTRAEPTAVDVVIDEPERTVTAVIMLPPHDTGAVEVPVWDTMPKRSADQANDAAVAVARRLAAACPEADVIEVVIIAPSGARLIVAGQELGHKRMGRDAFPDRAEARRSVGFQAAVRRLTASQSWTELITRQIQIARELDNLVSAAPSRLRPADNAARRRQWTVQVETQRMQASALSSRPVALAPAADLSHARADDADRQSDMTSDALYAVAQALARMVTDENRIGQASALRACAKRLLEARAASDPSLAGLGRPIPGSLIDGVKRLADLLMVLHNDVSAASRIRGADPAEAVGRLLAAASSRARARQRRILDSAVRTIPGLELHLVTDPDPLPGGIDDTAWLITAQANSWNTLVETLRELSAEDRATLDCNVAAIATTDEGRPLPIGIRLTRVGDLPELPMPQQMICLLAERAGLPVPIRTARSTAIAEIVDALTSMSWRIALLRRRPAGWPVPPAAAGPGMDDLRALASTTAESMPDSVADIVNQALTVLIDQLAAESDNATTVTLAGEIFDSKGLGPSSGTSAPQLWDALAHLSASMMTV